MPEVMLNRDLSVLGPCECTMPLGAWLLPREASLVTVWSQPVAVSIRSCSALNSLGDWPKRSLKDLLKWL